MCREIDLQGTLGSIISCWGSLRRGKSDGTVMTVMWRERKVPRQTLSSREKLRENITRKASGCVI